MNDRAASSRMRALYEQLPERGAGASIRDLLQTAVSAFCYHPSLNWIGRYVVYLAYTAGLFRRSTPDDELRGLTGADFMARMGVAQAALARLQWRDAEAIAQRCHDHGDALRAALRGLGAVIPGEPAPGEWSVAPRVSFLVRHRASLYRYFHDRGVELGEWFDGPLSPPPSEPVFNYSPGAYPNAERIAASVVNVPCHSRMTSTDVKRVVGVLRALHQDHPDQILRSPISQHAFAS